MKSTLIRFIFLTCIVLFSSCSEKYVILEGVSGIYINVSSSTNLIGEEISLQVMTENGDEVTDEAELFVNGELLEGNSFTSDEVGNYTFLAKYLNLESRELIIEYYDDGSLVLFKKRALIEDYTGTWCGWCPRVSHGMKLVAEETDAVEFVAIHRAPSGTQDPFNYLNAGPLEALINTAGYPKGFINRLTKWNAPEQENIGQVVSFTQGTNPRLGLKMDSELNGNNIQLKVEAQFAKNFEGIGLVVYLLENGLVYPQVNYTSFYGNVNPISDYVHNYTLRRTLTDILGDPIDANDTRTGNVYERSFDFEIPENIEDVSQVDFVAFMVDAEGHVINVRRAALGEVQEFEIE